MSYQIRSHIGISSDGVWWGLPIALLLFGLATSPTLTAPDLWNGSQAAAAEVDAIGAAVPTGFADVVERVKPAVVGVRVRIEATTHSKRRSFSRAPHSDRPALESGTALGSGFFISSDGDVVTNNHLVANGTSIEVTTDSGITYHAEIIGTDPETDLALLKVSASTDFPYVRLAADLPRVGDWVLPVGNPFGLGGTVTAGIVSARGRDIGADPYDDFIQIDAPVNLGSSGGPTFNVKGEVIGVNTVIFSPSGGFVGVAFDIPAETIRFVVQQLREKGHVTRGWIGVQIQSVTPPIAEAIELKNEEGALVAYIEPDSPAAKGGVEIGDVITSVDAESVKDSHDLARKIAAIAPGSSMQLGILRNGEEKPITVTVGKLRSSSTEPKKKEKKAPTDETLLGLTLAPVRAIAGAGDQGVVITDISPTSRASEGGLQTRDVILDVSRHAVNTPADVRNMVEEARTQSKRALLFRIKRGDVIRFVAVPLA